MNSEYSIFLVVFVDKNEGSADKRVRALRSWMKENFSTVTIEIVETGSKRVRRGALLKKCWFGSDCDLLFYADEYSLIDFDIFNKAFLVLSDNCDIVGGSRILDENKGKRPFLRKKISSVYNYFVRTMLNVRSLDDVQCHFKGIKKEAALKLLPKIVSDGSFFDTELIALAEKDALNIREIPVSFVEPHERCVDIFQYVVEDIVSLVRLKLNLLKSSPGI